MVNISQLLIRFFNLIKIEEKKLKIWTQLTATFNKSW